MSFNPRTDIGTTFGYGIHAISMLAYGESGVGKTRLAATTGDGARTLILAADPGQLTLRGESIRRIHIDSAGKFDAVLTWLESYSQHGKSLSERWRFVIMDSVTEIGEAILADMLARPAKSGDKGHGMAAYGDAQQAVMGFIKRLRDLPTHTITLAEQERVKDGETGNFMFGPSLPGKALGPKVPYKFDLVVAMRSGRDDKGQIIYWAQTANDGRYVAKDRSGALDAVERPSLATIVGKIIDSMPPEEATDMGPAQHTPAEAGQAEANGVDQ